MAQVAHWLKKTISHLIDPEKEIRVESLASALEYSLRTNRSAFTLEAVLAGAEPHADELAAATERVYCQVLSRAWSDGKITDSERQTLQWLAERLRIPSTKIQRLNVDHAKRHFAIALAQAMEDGVLDAQEEAKLAEIAHTVGDTLPQFMRSFFRFQGESFLRSIFLACVADNEISQSDWDYLLHITRRLGFDHQEMLSVIHVQARQFVEHVLADAKSDGRISDSEEKTLRWLVGNLGLPADYAAYVQREVEVLKTLTLIANGRLPSIARPNGMETRAGEIVHFHNRARWREVRLLKAGLQARDHEGALTLTDNRLVFSSITKPFSASYRKIVAHRGGAGFIVLQLENKPESVFFLSDDSHVPYAIFESAVGMANQTRIAHREGIPSRHIARDVRQRVWQRYGGRCVECNADEYLEFDHIIPVAKGGSSAESNIQLLCRRCNLKKSDSI